MKLRTASGMFTQGKTVLTTLLLTPLVALYMIFNIFFESEDEEQ